MRTLVFFSVLLVAGQVRGDDSYAREEEALRRTLFDKYDVNALPTKMTVVSFTGLEIRRLNMNEKDHVMEMSAWFKYKWDDPRLTWDANEHKDILKLGVDPTSIWKPDLSFYNTAVAKGTVRTSPIQAIIYPTGNIIHIPPYDVRLRCVMDLTYWPNDVHNCSLKMGSWIHSALVLDLKLEDYNVEVHTGEDDMDMGKNMTFEDFEITDWNVRRDEKYYDCCPEAYVSITTSFIVTRTSPAYDWTVKLPVVCLCLLTLVLFMLPPGAGEKLLFGGICLILDFLFLNYVTNEVSHVTAQTPLIVKLLGQQIVLVLASVFVSAIVVRMARGPHSTGLPPFLKGPFSTLAKFLCLGSYIDESSTPKKDDGELGSSKDLDKSEPSSPGEWLMLSVIVDRLALILYLAICIISLIRFSGVL